MKSKCTKSFVVPKYEGEVYDAILNSAIGTLKSSIKLEDCNNFIHKIEIEHADILHNGQNTPSITIKARYKKLKQTA